MDVARLEWWMIVLEAPTILIRTRSRPSFCWFADVRWLVAKLPSTFAFEIRVRDPGRKRLTSEIKDKLRLDGTCLIRPVHGKIRRSIILRHSKLVSLRKLRKLRSSQLPREKVVWDFCQSPLRRAR